MPRLHGRNSTAPTAISLLWIKGLKFIIGGDGARKLAWDSSWANWAINRRHQFARHWSRKPILRQVL